MTQVKPVALYGIPNYAIPIDGGSMAYCIDGTICSPRAFSVALSQEDLKGEPWLMAIQSILSLSYDLRGHYDSKCELNSASHYVCSFISKNTGHAFSIILSGDYDDDVQVLFVDNRIHPGRGVFKTTITDIRDDLRVHLMDFTITSQNSIDKRFQIRCPDLAANDPKYHSGLVSKSDTHFNVVWLDGTTERMWVLPPNTEVIEAYAIATLQDFLVRVMDDHNPNELIEFCSTTHNANSRARIVYVRKEPYMRLEADWVVDGTIEIVMNTRGSILGDHIPDTDALDILPYLQKIIIPTNELDNLDADADTDTDTDTYINNHAGLDDFSRAMEQIGEQYGDAHTMVTGNDDFSNLVRIIKGDAPDDVLSIFGDLANKGDYGAIMDTLSELIKNNPEAMNIAKSIVGEYMSNITGSKVDVSDLISDDEFLALMDDGNDEIKQMLGCDDKSGLVPVPDQTALMDNNEDDTLAAIMRVLNGGDGTADMDPHYGEDVPEMVDNHEHHTIENILKLFNQDHEAVAQDEVPDDYDPVRDIFLCDPNRSKSNLHRRGIKIMEELGEVAEAYLSVTSMDNTKDKSWNDVREELIDVVNTALDCAFTPLNPGETPEEAYKKTIAMLKHKNQRWREKLETGQTITY